MLERAGRAGGNLRTERIDGYLCEWGPNGFLDNVPETLALVRSIELDDRLLPGTHGPSVGSSTVTAVSRAAGRAARVRGEPPAVDPRAGCG